MPQDSVLRVNLDVRAGVPRAKVLQPGHQFLNGGSRTGVGIPPDVPHEHRAHDPPLHKQQSLPAAHSNYHPAAHSTHLHAHTATHYRESLDEPPKYDDIFKNHVNTEPSHLYQGQHKSYEKRHLKSYLLRHFPKAKTVNNRNRGTFIVNGGVTSSESGSVISGPSQCYAQINIPPTTPVEYPTPPPVGGAPPPHMRPSEAVQEQQQQQFRQQQFRQHHQFRHHQRFGQHHQQQQEGNRKFTITLKPGNYRVNVQWRSKTHPFRITLTPKKKTSREAPPPAEQQPLYYGTCHAHQQEDVQHSLPKRLVHRLLFRPHSPTVECSHQGGDDNEAMSPAQHPQYSVHLPNLQEQVTQQQLQLLQQQVGSNPVACGSRKGQKRCWDGVGPRHRQRKSRYRWASLSCMHLGNFDDSVGETSGGDSFGGYEGVEHLKRHTLSHVRAASCESLTCGCQGLASTAGSGVRPAYGNYGGRNMRRRVAALGVNARLNSLNSAYCGNGGGTGGGEAGRATDDSYIFIKKSQLKYHAVSCDVLRNDTDGEPLTADVLSKPGKVASLLAGERKTWHEDEAFVKQVVEEYFKDPVPLSDLEEKDSEINHLPTKRSMTADNLFGGKSVDLHDSSSSSSSDSTSTSDDDDEEEEDANEQADWRSPSIDDTYCDTDETNSWFTDDSLGYEADVEPSDKDTLGQVWRRWWSAPDVRPSSDVSIRRRGQQLGQAAMAAAPQGVDAADNRGGGRGGATKNSAGRVRWQGEDGGIVGRGWEAAAHAPPYKHSPVCGYQTRKSCSVDETKLSRLRLGLRRVKEHKLLQFPQHDLDSKRRPSRVNGQSNRNNERVRLGGGGVDVPSSVTTSPNKEEIDSPEFSGVVEKLEFVNGKFKAGADKDGCGDVLCECVRRNVEKVGVGGEGNVGGGRGGGGSSVDGGGSVDDSTTERTHRILTQGLVVHHSAVSQDHHLVLNGSVIKNALAVLREGTAAQELEAAKSVSCEATDTPGEKAVPSEPRRSKGAHGENKVVQGDERAAQGVDQEEIIRGESVNKGDLKEDKAPNESGETGLQEKEYLGAASDCEKQTVTKVVHEDHTEYVGGGDKVQEKNNEMNRSNISIHLTPPLPRRPSQDMGVELNVISDLKHKFSSAKPPHNSVPKDQPSVGSWGKSPSERNNSRIYQNIKQNDDSKVSGGHKVNDGTVNHNTQWVRNVLETGPTRRSSSVDSIRRSERTSSEWRASTDTLSSSSGTSSCCHAKPKPKSKTASKSKPLSPGHGRRRQVASREEDLGTTSSSSAKVFDNEFHVHRVQVATGSDRKFALTTQRTVIEVPLSGGEQSDSQTLRAPREESKQGGGRAPVQKSELVLGPPQFGGSQSGRHKHPPTFLTSAFPSSSSTCISEYNIGDAHPAPPESPKHLPQEFKFSNIDVKTSKPVSDAKDEYVKKSSKNSSKNKTKSKPRRYFSGILNAFGSAAPRFKGVHTPDAKGEGVKKERDARKLVSEGCSQVLPDPTPRSGNDLADNRSSNRTKFWSGSGVSGKPDAASSTKTEVLQVCTATKDSSRSGSEYAALSDVVPVPSPRPRRARKNSHDSADNVVAPTPPTRRKNTEESAGKTFINGGSNEWGGQRFESPRASPRVRRGREPNSQSVERNFRCNLPTTSEHPAESSLTLRGSNHPPTPRPQVSYENLTFHESPSFCKQGIPSASDRSCNSKEDLSRIATVAKISPLSTRRTSNNFGSENHRSLRTESDGRSRSRSTRTHVESSGECSERIHEQGRRSRKNSGGSNGEREDKNGYNAGPRSTSGENGSREVEVHSSGSRKENSGSRIHQENSVTHTSDSRRDTEEMNINRRSCSEDWQRTSVCLDGGGETGRSNLGGTLGLDLSTGTPGRRRRSRPPSLPTTPPQSSRHRRTSHSSGTSGGSLTSSPTRWRRPQAEDTWEDSSLDGSREGRLSNSPSAESIASDSTSFYYSAVGSTVYDRPKSLCEDLTERYSFITCPQDEPLSSHQETADADCRSASAASVELHDSASVTSIPRTISGDLNCDVDVSLSEGEVKIRVRSDEDVTSLTSVRDDSDTESDSDEYELSGGIKTEEESRKSDSSEICDETSASENFVFRVCESKDEPPASDSGMVHAVPCVTRTDSSSRSSLSSFGMPAFPDQFMDSLSSQDSKKKESSLVHASPCWATTDSDLRSSVSSTDYYGKVYLSATPKERVYEPDYENLKEENPLAEFLEGNRGVSEDRASESSEPKTEKRRLSGFWTTSGESDLDNSDWEEETLSADLQKSFTKVGDQDAAEGEAPQSSPLGSQFEVRSPPEYHEAADYSIVEDDFIPEEVHPLSPTPRFHNETSSADHTETYSEAAPSDAASKPQHATPGWEQHAAAWEWHKVMWQHHQHLHQHHLRQIHQHHQQHQSLLADVMSCLGGRWGVRAGWCHQSYSDSPHTYPDDSGTGHVQNRTTPACRWVGQCHDDPPYRPAKASSPCDMGKPPRSPLPPSGSHRSRDASSVPREGSRPQSRQRSRSRRRAYSANSKYRVELEIPPHLLSRPRPSSFTSLASRRPGSHSPEPLEDDLRHETLQYLSGAAHDHSVDASRRRYCCVCDTQLS